MINLAQATQYFKIEIQRSKGLIKNIFLSNSQNEIITTGDRGRQQSAVLSDFLNSALCIIGFNLYGQQRPRPTEKPLQMSVSLPQQQAFLFSIKNQFILGVLIDSKQKNVGHKMAVDIMKFVQNELQNVAEWIENNDIY